jgi:hypothetical protein
MVKGFKHILAGSISLAERRNARAFANLFASAVRYRLGNDMGNDEPV